MRPKQVARGRFATSNDVTDAAYCDEQSGFSNKPDAGRRSCEKNSFQTRTRLVENRDEFLELHCRKYRPVTPFRTFWPKSQRLVREELNSMPVIAPDSPRSAAAPVSARSNS